MRKGLRNTLCMISVYSSLIMLDNDFLVPSWMCHNGWGCCHGWCYKGVGTSVLNMMFRCNWGWKGVSWRLFFSRLKSEWVRHTSLSGHVPAPLRTYLPRVCGGEGFAALLLPHGREGKGGEGRGEKCVAERDWDSHPTQLTALPVKTWQAVGGTSPLETAWTEGVGRELELQWNFGGCS